MKRLAEVTELLNATIGLGPAAGRRFVPGFFGLVQLLCVGHGWANADPGQPRPGTVAQAARWGAWVGSRIDVATFVRLNTLRHRLVGRGPVPETRMDEVRLALSTPGDVMGHFAASADRGRIWPPSLQNLQPNAPEWVENRFPALGSTGAGTVRGHKPRSVRMEAHATFRATRGSDESMTIAAPVLDAGREFEVRVSPPRRSTYLLRDAGELGWRIENVVLVLTDTQTGARKEVTLTPPSEGTAAVTQLSVDLNGDAPAFAVPMLTLPRLAAQLEIQA